ncbi:MAG: alanine racemase [Rickettsiella sp.]|nr:alanine racemase [Rickettsiella sp.]
MSRPVIVELDLNALRHNVMCLRKIAPQSKILAMVKANAYGHGLIPIARALASFSVEGFGVSCSEEALVLRKAGIKQKIVLMEGLFSEAELPLLDNYQLDTVIYNRRQLSLLTQQPLAKSINVWIKINTGMNRLGLSSEDFPEVWHRCQSCPWINIVCVMTHFSSADITTDKTTLQQIKYFKKITQDLTIEKSLANSAAILFWSDSHADWIRPGLVLYGVSPFADASGIQHGLKPVMSLKSEIIAINYLELGDRVGYGGTWAAPDTMKIGVVAMGYGDGYPHRAASGTPILINDQLVELVGQVSMDMLTVDLRTQPHGKQGDPVTLWGAGLPIEQIAMSTSTFRYELLCGINRGQLVRVRLEEKNDAG